MNKDIFSFVFKISGAALLVLCIFMGLSAFDHLHLIKQKMFVVKLIHAFCFSFLILFIAYLITREKISTKIFTIGLLSISFGLRLFYIFRNNPDQVSDFLYMYLQAKELAQGQPDALKTDYYDFAIFNSIFTIYESYLLKWFDSVRLLKVLSVIYSTFIVFYIYKIGRLMSGEKTGRIAGLIACLFPPFIIYNVVLTNQTLSILLILMGIHALMNKKYIQSGLFLALGQAFRPIGIIFLMGGVLMIFMKWLKKEEIFAKEKIKKVLISTVKLLLPYYAVLLMISGGLMLFNFTDHGLFHNPAPSYKFLVGLNKDTQGSYSKDDSDLLIHSDEFERLAKQQIDERTISINEVAQLFEIKFKKMWGSPDASFFWAKIYKSTPNYLTQFLWILILFSAGSLLFFRNKTDLKEASTDRKFYINIVLLGFILVYFLIEIQTRYRYELYPLFILVAAPGMLQITERSKTFLKQDKRRLPLIACISAGLFVITMLPDAMFYRNIQKEVELIGNEQIIEVDQTLSKNIKVENLVIATLPENKLLLRFELSDKVRGADIYPFAITLRTGESLESDKKMLGDFKPILYKDQGKKYMETIIDQPAEPIQNLYLALYDRNGFKGFKSAYLEIKITED